MNQKLSGDFLKNQPTFIAQLNDNTIARYKRNFLFLLYFVHFFQAAISKFGEIWHCDNLKFIYFPNQVY